MDVAILQRAAALDWADEKLRIVAATYEPGTCVKQAAAAYDLYPGLLFTWRRQMREGTLAPAATPMSLPVRAAAAVAVAPSGGGGRGRHRKQGTTSNATRETNPLIPRTAATAETGRQPRRGVATPSVRCDMMMG